MSGIHHVTAICGSAERNLDFYTRTLGLRFVKKTVNFDDPGAYHLYYGDHVGHPGTIVTFFAWELASAGRPGVGFTEQVALQVPAGSLGYWTQRFSAKDVPHGPLSEVFGQPVLPFSDPDGMQLTLVGVENAGMVDQTDDGDVVAEHAIRGVNGVTLLLESTEATATILVDVFGLKQAGAEGVVSRYVASDVAVGGVVDLREVSGSLRGNMGRGVIHHVAFRAQDDAAQARMAAKLRDGYGLQTTDQKDRQYFRSVYFREPGGVILEIATDQPGFTVDEPIATLGTALKLPPFLEPHRKQIEATLPPLGRAA